MRFGAVLASIFIGGLLGVAVAGVGVFAWTRLDWDRLMSPRRAASSPAPPEPSSAAPRPGSAPVMRTIYLNREGAELVAGSDDARFNQSSIVANAGLTRVTIPAFAGTPRRWGTIVKCVRSKFAPFDVEVVDRRPVRGRYIMAVFGGRSKLLRTERNAHKHNHRISGLAPFNGKLVSDAVVLVFSRQLRERTRTVCEVAAMEIAHTYGLDHARHCKDLMSYVKPCGPRVFTDRHIACGEHAVRACRGGARSQNSHAMLLDVLGPAKSVAASRRSRQR